MPAPNDTTSTPDPPDPPWEQEVLVYIDAVQRLLEHPRRRRDGVDLDELHVAQHAQHLLSHGIDVVRRQLAC